jgi:membrane protease YdiL (CAAX protease family)
LGPKAAISISALSFGVYHWFSYGVLGNFMPMLVVLISTGLMGWAWALAFVKTRSIFMPIGFHFGWNLMYNTGFSKGPLGDGLLILEEAQPITETLSTLNFLVGALIIPLIVLLSVAFGLKKSAPIDRPSEKVEIF